MTGNETPSRAVRILSIVGGIALLLAMTTDVISVIGRHTAWPLIGSIEFVQAAVVISAAAGMIVATIERSHAIVHVVAHRLSRRPRQLLMRVSWLVAACFFAALAAGAAWSALAHWGGHEESEVLGIPYAPLRLVLVAACTVVAGVFAWQSWQGEPE